MSVPKNPSPTMRRLELQQAIKRGSTDYDLGPKNRRQRRQLAKVLARERKKQGGKP